MFWRLSAISLSLVAVDVGARTQSGGALAHLDYLAASASLPLSPVRRPWPTTVKGGTGGDNLREPGAGTNTLGQILSAGLT